MIVPNRTNRNKIFNERNRGEVINRDKITVSFVCKPTSTT